MTAPRRAGVDADVVATAGAVGIMGGTFDPPHLGHLILAEEARSALGLARVLFVPAGEPWRKAGRRITPATLRAEMVAAAVADDPCFDVSLIEVERSGPSYTVETLQTLASRLGPAVPLTFILGQDALADLPHWRDPAGIVARARLAVAQRPGRRPPPLAEVERAVPGIGVRLDVVPMPLIAISSTDIRRRVAEGRTIRYLVPPAVRALIEHHRLYRV